MRPLRVAATACTAPGWTTPSTSTPSVVCIIRSRSAGSAAAVAELQATTSSLIRRASSSSAISSENASSSAAVALPVREARGVREVHEVLVRELHEQLVQDRQAADAGVEDPDRAAAKRFGRGCGRGTRGQSATRPDGDHVRAAAVTARRRRRRSRP